MEAVDNPPCGGHQCATFSSVLSILGLLVLSSAAHAADPATTCESGKLKEAGKYGSCRLGVVSRAVRGATTPDYSKCDSRFGDKWPNTETKGAGMCPSNGDQTDIAQRVAEHADDIAILLGGGGSALRSQRLGLADPGQRPDGEPRHGRRRRRAGRRDAELRGQRRRHDHRREHGSDVGEEGRFRW